jgi:hypothetical protein
MDIDPNLQRMIEDITQQSLESTERYKEFAQFIYKLRIHLDQEAFNEQMGSLGDNLIARRFLAWLAGGDTSEPLSNKPVVVTIGDSSFLIDFTGTDPTGKKVIHDDQLPIPKDVSGKKRR